MKSWLRETPKELQQMRREGSPGGRIIDYSRPENIQTPNQGTYQIIDYSRPENMQTPNQGTQTRSQTWDTPSRHDQQMGHTGPPFRSQTWDSSQQGPYQPMDHTSNQYPTHWFEESEQHNSPPFPPFATRDDFSQSPFNQPISYTDYQYSTHPTGLVERTVALHISDKDLQHPRIQQMLSSTSQDTVGSSMVDLYSMDQAMTPRVSSSDRYDGMPPPALPTGGKIRKTQNRRLRTKDVTTTPEAKGMQHPSRSKSQEKIINTLKSRNSQLDKLEQGIDGLRHSLEDPASYSSDTGKFSYSESVPEADRTRFDAMIPTYINGYNKMAQKIREVKTEIERREREMVTSSEASNAATGMQVEKPRPKRRRTTEKDPETRRR